MTIADRVRNRREQLGLSQEELAKRMGYSGKSSISKIESSGNDITLKKMKKLSKALNVSIEYLAGFKPQIIGFGEDGAIYSDMIQDYLQSCDGEENKIRFLEEIIENSTNNIQEPIVTDSDLEIAAQCEYLDYQKNILQLLDDFIFHSADEQSIVKAYRTSDEPTKAMVRKMLDIEN